MRVLFLARADMLDVYRRTACRRALLPRDDGQGVRRVAGYRRFGCVRPRPSSSVGMTRERFALRHGQVMRLMVCSFGDESREAETPNAREGLGVIRLLRDDNHQALSSFLTSLRNRQSVP